MADWEITPLTVVMIALPGLAYIAARIRLRQRHVAWASSRDVAFAAGLLCVAGATMSPLAVVDEEFPVHVLQHLLLGMAAPIGFALSAPITLLLRAGPLTVRRSVTRFLHRRLVRWVSWAPVGAACRSARCGCCI